MKVALTFLLTILLSTSLAVNTFARPEFAAQEDKDCNFCHIDPAGGGPRNAVGQVFEDNYFEFPEDFDPDAIMEAAEETIQKLTTAIDIRTAFIKTLEVDEEERAVADCNSCHSSVDSFYMMQGELTVNAQASDKLRLTLSNNMGSTLNMFATIDAVPQHLYVKVGQFRLPFGIKQKDHNILVRQGFDLASNKRDVGVEVGGSYNKLFYNAALFNGANTTIFNGGGAIGVDANQDKGIVATVGSTVGPVRAGVSGLFNKPQDNRELTVGAFLTAVYQDVTLEGEFDFGGSFAEGESVGLSNEDITAKGYFVGARYRATPKLLISGRYGLFDSDRNIKGDAEKRITLSTRYNIVENGSLELYYWANIENKDSPKGAREASRQLRGIDQLILMSHFWF